MKRERSSNFEILRIISMCGIIALHYLAGHLGGMVENPKFPELEWFLSQTVNSIACPLVNCFVLISGYFLIKKDSFGLRKAIDLIAITSFYGLIGYIVGIITNTVSWSMKGFVFAIFPFFDGKRWFVETYIILILIAPYINKLLLSIDRKSFEILLSIQIVVFSVWYSIGLSAPVLDDGYGIINFITLYLLGAYINLYGKKSILWRCKKVWLLLGYLGCAVLTFALSYFIYPFGYSFITNIAGALFIFIFFAKLNIGCNQKINGVSAAAFDVYFVHSDAYTSRLLIYELLQGKLFVGSVWIIPHMFFTIIILYLFGIVAFKLRSYVFSKCLNKCLDRLSLINETHRI